MSAKYSVRSGALYELKAVKFLVTKNYAFEQDSIWIVSFNYQEPSFSTGKTKNARYTQINFHQNQLCFGKVNSTRNFYLMQPTDSKKQSFFSVTVSQSSDK
jgi:hypothetical protein